MWPRDGFASLSWPSSHPRAGWNRIFMRKGSCLSSMGVGAFSSSSECRSHVCGGRSKRG